MCVCVCVWERERVCECVCLYATMYPRVGLLNAVTYWSTGSLSTAWFKTGNLIHAHTHTHTHTHTHERGSNDSSTCSPLVKKTWMWRWHPHTCAHTDAKTHLSALLHTRILHICWQSLCYTLKHSQALVDRSWNTHTHAHFQTRWGHVVNHLSSPLTRVES